MGRNTTGPPCSGTVELQLDWRRHDVIGWPARVKPPAGPPWSVTDDDIRQTTTADDDRRQTAKQYWPPYNQSA